MREFTICVYQARRDSHHYTLIERSNHRLSLPILIFPLISPPSHHGLNPLASALSQRQFCVSLILRPMNCSYTSSSISARMSSVVAMPSYTVMSACCLGGDMLAMS